VTVLYYGIEIWFHSHLAFDLKRRIRAVHYRAMRLIYEVKSGTQPSMGNP